MTDRPCAMMRSRSSGHTVLSAAGLAGEKERKNEEEKKKKRGSND
jgi:hypothetical protein